MNKKIIIKKDPDVICSGCKKVFPRSMMTYAQGGFGYVLNPVDPMCPDCHDDRMSD